MAGKRNIISTALVIVSAAILAFVLYRSDNSVHFSKLFVNADELGQIISTRTQAVDDLLDFVVFDDEELFFDSQADTFYYSLQEGSSDAYNPCVKWNSDNNTALAVLGQEITPEVIKNNCAIEMLAYNDNEYKRYQLKCTTLPLLNIECPEEIVSDTDELLMDITLFDNRKGAVGRITHSDGTIHTRGASTKDHPKKSFRFSLTQNSLGENRRKNNVSLLGMRQDDDWILYPAYNDQEKIRNVFSSNLWKYSCDTDNRYKISTGTEYKYLELFINGEYHGLYALGYPIDEKLLGVDAERNAEYLYKKVGYDDERMLRITGLGIDGYEVKNGLSDEGLVEYQILLKEWTPLIEYYRNLYINRDNNEELLKGIDIDNAIDFYLFINLIQGRDNVAGDIRGDYTLTKNLFLTIKNDNGNLVGIYSPWDLDITWGNDFLQQYTVSPEADLVMECGYLYEILKNDDPDIWELLFDKYRQLRNTTWSDEFIADLLDEYEADIFFSGAYLRDMERWPDGIYWETDDNLNIFKEYVSERLKAADDYYKRLEEAVNKGEAGTVFNFTADYTFPELTACTDLDSYLHDVDNSNYDMVIEFGNNEILLDESYVKLLADIGIKASEINNDTDMIIVNGDTREAVYLDNFHVSGNSVDTAFGEMFIFINESGEGDSEPGTYGFYVDGEELYVVNPQDNEGTDIRITLVDRNTLEIIDCVSFAYTLQQQEGGYTLQTTGLKRKN